MPINLPRVGHGGGRTPENRPDEFPHNIDILRRKTHPETIVFNNETNTITSRPYTIAACEYWSVYVFGNNDTSVDIEVSMNPEYNLWAKLTGSALAHEDIYEDSGGQHPWVRFVINNAGTGTTLHFFRKYATY